MDGNAELLNLINRRLIRLVVGNCNSGWSMLAHLIQQLPHLRMGTQRNGAIGLPETPDHIQRINPDRPG